MPTAQEELETLRAQNAALQAKLDAKKNAPITYKVSEKGAVSVYGLGRFPVTLYSAQMTRLLDKADEIRAFMVANVSKLATKE